MSFKLNNIVKRLYRPFFLLLLVWTATSASGIGQSIQKVTAVKQANSSQFQVRLHMDKLPRQATMAQVHPNHLELKIDDSNAKLERLKGDYPHPIANLRRVIYSGGLGLVFDLKPGAHYTSSISQDLKSKDLIITLNQVNEQESIKQALTQKGFGWVEAYKAPTASTETFKNTNTTPKADPLPDITDETYLKIKNSAKFDVVVIDAGHGGHDSGALGYARNKEKEVALKTALKLGELIQRNLPEVKVVYTRSDDTFITLADRGKIANKAQGDLFISVHCNAARSRAAYGVEVFFLGSHRTEDALEVMVLENSVIKFEEQETTKTTEMSPEQLLAYELANSGNISSSEKIASLMIDEFTGFAKRPSRGVKQAGFWVLYHASMPSVLVELGFISNKDEEAYLITDQAQDELAISMFRAVKRYKEQYERTLNMVAEPVKPTAQNK